MEGSSVFRRERAMAWQALLVATPHLKRTIIDSKCENVKASSGFSTRPE